MNLYGISGEIFLAISGMIALLISVFSSNGSSLKITTRFCNLSLLISLILIVLSHQNSGYLFNEMYVHDALSRYTKSLILIGTILTLIISSKPQKIDGFNRPEYPILILFSVIGMLLMASSTNLISLYMALELQSLPLYVIAAINRDNLKSSEAGLKYFILGALSSGLLLFGMSLVYGAVGDTSFSSISLVSSQGMTSLLLIGLVFMLSGLAFKISAVPFHMWTPDVYQGAPTPVTNFLATVSKGAMLIALTRFTIDGQLHQYTTFTICLSVLAIISMLVGNWLALRQQQIKRLLAYSSIAHFGYLLVALVALRQLQESQQIFNSSLEAINFYITAYIITSLAAFTVVANIGGENDPDMRSFAGLFWRKPLQAGTLTVAMLSFAGIPLTAGFLGKFYLITLALNTNLWLLLITLVVGSAIAIYYYLRVIYSMLGIRSPDNDYQLSRTPLPMWRDILAIILMVFVLLLGSWPQPFIDFMRHL